MVTARVVSGFAPRGPSCFVTKGADPTEMEVYELTKGGDIGRPFLTLAIITRPVHTKAERKPQ